jgi:mono/diheme cytochrome c family protein
MAAAAMSLQQHIMKCIRINGRMLLGVVLCVAIFVGAAVWIITAPRAPFQPGDDRLEGVGDPQRGRLIFAAGDCASCHATPGQSDRLHLGGGLALASPYGTFRMPNISPDKADGIGSWSTVDLANALIGGVSPRGEHYYPALPYPSYAGLKLMDVRDLMAYLRTLTPVAGKAPPHDLAAIFGIRRLVGAWKLLFFKAGGTVPPPSGDARRDRGAYLVEAMTHCAECHSTRNLLGAIKGGARFAGGPDPEGVGFVPNITPARIGSWSEAEIAEVLKTGRTPQHGRVGSSMLDVVTNTAMLPQADRDAIAAYIKSLPARETPRP